jgi:hypothetical protein
MEVTSTASHSIFTIHAGGPHVRARWIAAAAPLLALDAYLLIWQWPLVGGNVLAEALIVTPAFLAQHLALRRHVDRRHSETHARLDEALRRDDTP